MITNDKHDTSTTAAGLADAAVVKALSRRALCPDCASLGGCRYGIPGLLPVPDRNEQDPITEKSKSYWEALIKNAVVIAFRLLSHANATKGETFVAGPSLCAALTRGQIIPDTRDKEASP